MEVLKGNVFRALIVRTKINKQKKDGSFFGSQENAVVLINKQGNPIGTRIIGSISKTLKKTKFIKILNLCKGLI